MTMMLTSDLMINLVLVLAVLWRLPLKDWASQMLSTSQGSPAQDWTLRSRAEGAVWGAILGDALALQTHYEYDYQKIRDFYRINLNGTVEKLAESLRANAEVLGLAITPDYEGADFKNWHPGKGGGDLTDYGDCVVMALEFLSSHEWSASKFEEYWWEWIQAYKGYLNWATKDIMESRRKKVSRPGKLGWPPAEDLFAVCRLPALLFAFREDIETPVGECEWSTESSTVLRPYPRQLSHAFRPPDATSQAVQTCQEMGVGLCGGVTCWVTRKSEAKTGRPELACALALVGAQELRKGKQGGTAHSKSLVRCAASNATRSLLPQAAMESASIQYATETTFAACSFLATLAQRLIRSNATTQTELRALTREVANGMLLRGGGIIRTVLDAVEQKLAEVEEHGASWSPDPVEVDDIALRTFSLAKTGVESLSYPCKQSECSYWDEEGKASPTLPGLVAVLYLFLRYAEQPMDHVLAVNALLGGDNAARGVPLGMLLGAVQGAGAVPQRLRAQLNAESHVAALLQKL